MNLRPILNLRWIRRSISISAVLIATVVLTCALPLGLLVTGLGDIRASPRRWPHSRALIALILYFLAECVGLLGSLLVWLRYLGGMIGTTAQWHGANAALENHWAYGVFRCVRCVYGMRVQITGTEHIMPAPFVLFARHVSIVDTLLAAVFVARPHHLVLRYVVKQELLWDPCVDIVGSRLPNAFVKRTANTTAQRDAELNAIRALADNLDQRTGVLIYPEGTRFRASRLHASVAKLAQQGWSDLAGIAGTYRHVLPPRLGGPLAVLDAAPHADVLIMAHTGLEGARTLASLWRGDLIGSTLRIHITRIPAKTIPRDQREQWLFGVWQQMDQWIDIDQADHWRLRTNGLLVRS